MWPATVAGPVTGRWSPSRRRAWRVSCPKLFAVERLARLRAVVCRQTAVRLVTGLDRGPVAH